MDDHPTIPAEACGEPHHMRGKIECALVAGLNARDTIGQMAQRFANGAASDAQLVGQLGLGRQAQTGRIGAVHDAPQEHIRNPPDLAHRNPRRIRL